MGFRVVPILYSVALTAFLVAILSVAISAELTDEDGPFGPANPPPEPFEDYAFLEPQMVPTSDDLPSGTDIEHFDAVVGADGAVHAVWQETIDGTYSVFYAKRWPGRTAFDPAHRLSNASWNSREPNVALSGNGTVHITWVNGTWGSYRQEIVLARSFPGHGGFWVQEIWSEHDIQSPSLEVTFDGTVFFAYTYWEEAILAEGSQSRFPYRCFTGCVVLKWNETMDDTRETYVYGISEKHPLREVRAHLCLSPAGNPHVVVESQDYLYWTRSVDGGEIWSEPINWFEGPVKPVEFTAEALPDERIAIAYSKRPHDHMPSWPFHRCGYYISLIVSDPTGMSSTENLTERSIESLNLLSAAFDVQPFEGGVWLAFLGFSKEKAGEPNLDGSLTPRLYAYLLRHDGTTAGPLEVADVPGRPELDPDLAEGRLNESVLSMGLEADGRPFVAAATPLRSEEPIKGYVWRVNHPPMFPLPLSEIQGGWIFDNPFDLQVERSIDIDGDDLVYEFLIVYRWGSFFTGQFTENTPYARFLLPGNGDYCWTVRISDPWVTVGIDEDWWFRFDLAPPRADAGGPYVCDEGGSVLINGGRSTDERPLTLWEWDMDGDGTFERSLDHATFEHTALDDAVTRISLRVTDVAGRTDVDHSQLVVINLDPVATVTGPRRVQMDLEATFNVKVTDNGTEDAHFVTWFVGGSQAGEGFELSHTFDKPGVFKVAARVVDDDGGHSTVEIDVVVMWVDAPYVRIAYPEQVIQGDLFHVYVSESDLNPFVEWALEWSVDGVRISDGLEAWCSAEKPGEVSISFSATSTDGTELTKGGTVLVRERLLPVALRGVTDLGVEHMVVEWTRCEQKGLFEGYEVVLSNRPVVPWDPNGTSDPPSQLFLRFAIDDVDSTSHNITDLDGNTTYYVYVDVLGEGQRAHSNVHSASTLTEPPAPQPQPPDDDGDHGGLRVSPAQALGLLLLAVVMTFGATYVYMKRKG